MKNLLIFLLLLSNSIIAQVNLTKGLVAWYPFTGNANDASGNNNNPVFNNTSFVADRFGNKNSACYFNGKNNYIRIKNNSALSPEEMSLVAIIKPTGFYMGTCYNNAIIDKGSWDYLYGNYSLRFTAGEYTKGDCYESALKYQNFVGATSFNDGSTSKNLYVKLDSWYCIVYTFSKQYSKLYVNGQLVSSSKPKGSIGKNGQDVFLGKKDNDQYPYWFKGIMDEIRIYNRALNSDEVLALCNMPVNPSNTNPPCPDISKPSANFTYTFSSCNKVSFESASPNLKNIKTIKWLFGDGSTSDKLSPEHTYTKYGTYKVKVIASNEFNCSDTVVKEIQVRELITDFVYTEQGEPGKIQFKAKNNNASYSWNFGDDKISQKESVITHSFNQTGKYTVRLFAQNNSGCRDTVQKNITITLPEPVTTITLVKKAPIISTPPPEKIQLEQRTKDLITTIPVENDSITVSLYDNGIIDGDSITLIYNNIIILTHQLLKDKPVTLRLKINPERNNNELVMYAENLGSIPPNTALMIIMDGENRYQVNVSSTKTTNGIISFTVKNKNLTASQ